MNRAASLVAVLALVCSCSRPPEPPDRSKPPALGPAPELKLPPIQKATLANGLPVVLVESHEVPLVQVNLVILTGSADDPADKFGVASLTAAMLDEGAGQRTALQIADDVEFLGAALETSSSFDASAVRLNVPSARLAAALPIMADVALRPTFPQAELDRLRQERLTTLIQARDDAAQVAPLAFSRVVFGGTHRYGTAAMGTPSTLKAFTTMDLRTFLATVIIVLFLVTIVMAIGSYGAYKLRERRRPVQDSADAGVESQFFERLSGESLDADSASPPARRG